MAAPARRSGSGARRLAWLWRRPGLAFGSAVFLGAATAIAANALVFQTGRHPAPLFGAAPAPVLP
ncbi:MAG TPA: peptidoglycan-binding protein, partial [Beijerinckiaceae bacterium]|nr:peptidoglycan-binding protein [Beijerinckiaceae bacterium]